MKEVAELKIILDLCERFMPKNVAVDDSKQMAMYEAYHRIKKLVSGLDESQSATEWEEKLYDQLNLICDEYSNDWDDYDQKQTADLLYDYQTRNIP